MMKVGNKLFSIIMPAYNVQDYIEDCVASCENQDIDEDKFELIIINDGSKDATLEKINTLQSKYSNIKLLNQNNQGQSVARNEGIKSATGKYLWFVDSDDRVSLNCLGRIFQIMEDENLDVFNIVSKVESKFLEEIYCDTDLSCKPVISGETYLLNYIPIIAAPWGYVFKRQFWQESGFSFIPGIYYEDSQLIPIVLSKCRRITSFTNDVSCYDYITRPVSTVNSAPNIKKINGYLSIVNTHLKYSENVDSKELRRYFEVSASYSFIEGIKMILRYDKDVKLYLSNFLERVNKRPHKIFATTLLKKIQQYLILYFPKMYCAIIKMLDK